MIPARHLEIATQLLTECPTPLDRWPYTELFAAQYERFCERCGSRPEPNRVWHTFVSVRKRGKGGSTRRSHLATV